MLISTRQSCYYYMLMLTAMLFVAMVAYHVAYSVPDFMTAAL